MSQISYLNTKFTYAQVWNKLDLPKLNNWLIFLKFYISDTGNEAILEGVKITGNAEDLELDFETSEDCKNACLSR